MKTRIISAIGGAIILASILYAGGFWVVITCFAINLIATYEALKLVPYNQARILTYTFVIVFMTLALISPNLTNFIYGNIIICSLLITICILYAIVSKSSHPPYKRIIYMCGIPIYTGFLLSHILLIYQGTSLPEESNLKILLFTLIITFTTDTGAYFFGTLFGKIKIAPTISINKTLEGSIGGFVSGVIMAVLVSILLNMEFPLLQILTVGVAISLSAQLGDLLESKLKRIINTKESGRFMPGHGGLLDRIDSLIITLPVAYYFFWAIS